MSEVAFIIVIGFFILLGTASIVVGIIILEKQTIKLIRRTYYMNVKPNDIKAYTKAIGIGTIGLGISCLGTGLLFIVNMIPIGLVFFIICFLLSNIVFFIGQKKYNNKNHS